MAYGRKEKTKELELKGTPSERQIEFFKATARNIGYGGARGGGKSWAMRRKFVLLALNYEGLRLLLLRRTLPQLYENHERPLSIELNGYVNYNQTRHEFLFPNGSLIKMGYCEREEDVLQYQGQEFDVIGFEEATQFTEYQMRWLSTSCRSVRTDFKPRMYYTCNPGGPGHDYIKRIFVDRVYTEDEDGDDYVFIPAKVYDNAVLMENNPEYIKTLKALPDHLRRAYLDGDWDVIEGQYFSEWDRNKHVVEPFTIPREWRKFRAMDWGYNDPTCCLWFAVAPDGHIYVYREIYERQHLASDTAKQIKELSAFEEITYTVASPDMWQKRGVKDIMGGENIAETFTTMGVPLIKADNARVVGWQRVREFLSSSPDGSPYLRIFSSCKNLIRTLPTLYYDEHDHEDVSDKCEDHAPEALRYGCMSRPSPNKEMERVMAKVIKFDPFKENKRVANSNDYLTLR